MISSVSTANKMDTQPKIVSSLADVITVTVSVICHVTVPQSKPVGNQKFVISATKWATLLENVPNPPNVSFVIKSDIKLKTVPTINKTNSINKFNVPSNLEHASTAKNKATTPLIVQNHQDVISVDNKDIFPGIVPIMWSDQILLMEA